MVGRNALVGMESRIADFLVEFTLRYWNLFLVCKQPIEMILENLDGRGRNRLGS